MRANFLGLWSDHPAAKTCGLWVPELSSACLGVQGTDWLFSSFFCLSRLPFIPIALLVIGVDYGGQEEPGQGFRPSSNKAVQLHKCFDALEHLPDDSWKASEVAKLVFWRRSTIPLHAVMFLQTLYRVEEGGFHLGDCKFSLKITQQSYQILVMFMRSFRVCASVLCKSLQSCPTPCGPTTVVHQTPLSLESSRKEYCSGLPCRPPGDLPNPGIEPTSLTSLALAGRFFTTSPTWAAPFRVYVSVFIDLNRSLTFCSCQI